MKDDKRLKRKVRNSYIVSTVSITLVLFLLSFYIIICHDFFFTGKCKI